MHNQTPPIIIVNIQNNFNQSKDEVESVNMRKSIDESLKSDRSGRRIRKTMNKLQTHPKFKKEYEMMAKACVELDEVIEITQKLSEINDGHDEELKSDDDINRWLVNEYFTYLSKNKERYVTKYEAYNIEMLCEILENSAKLQQQFPKVFTNRTINQLRILNKLAPNGIHKCYYLRSKLFRTTREFEEYGRLYAYKIVGLQLLKREVRALLSYGIYYDIDIVNCHPTILLQIAKDNEINCPNLKNYMEKREKYLKIITDNNDITRSDAKKLVISIINGGRKDYKALRKKPAFLKKLMKEFENIRDKVVSNNQLLYQDIKKSNLVKFNRRMQIYKQCEGKGMNLPILSNAAISTVSYFLQHKENEILQVMIGFFQEKNVLIEDVCVLVFDGIQIPASNQLRELIPECELRIEEATGISAKLAIKEINDDLGLITDKNKVIPWEEVKKCKDAIIKSKTFDKMEKAYKSYSFFYKKSNEQAPIAADINYSDGRLPVLTEIINENETILIKSPMDTGKTYQLYQYLHKYAQDKRILIVSFRKSLERKYYNDLRELDFTYYDDENTHSFEAHKYPHLIIQINSLWKVHGSYDILVLDEASYTIDLLLDWCKKRREVYAALNSFIKNCGKVIAMDAYLTGPNMDYIKNKRKGKKSLTIENKIAGHDKMVHLVSKNVLFEKMRSLLAEGKKISLSSNSCTFLEKEAFPILKKVTENILIITSNSRREDVKVADWGNYDVVMYSPTITAGLSYDVRNVFECRFAYFTNKSASAELGTQMLFRIRHTNQNKLYISINSKGKRDYPTSRKGIMKWLTSYINGEKSIRQIKGSRWNKTFKGNLIEYDNFHRKYTESDYLSLLIDCFRKKFVSNNDFGSTLLYYLYVQGWVWKPYKLSKMEFKRIKHSSEIRKKYLKFLSNEDIKATIEEYRSFPIPTESQYLTMKKKRKKAKSDKIRINLYNISETFETPIDQMDDQLLLKVIRNFNYHYLDKITKGVDSDNIKKFVYDRGFANVQQYMLDWHKNDRRDFFLKKYLALEIIEIIGYLHMNDDSNLFVDEQIMGETSDYFSKYFEKFKLFYQLTGTIDDFGEKFNNKAKFSKFINKLIKCTGRKLKKVKKRNGKVCIYNHKLSKVVEM